MVIVIDIGKSLIHLKTGTCTRKSVNILDIFLQSCLHTDDNII